MISTLLSILMASPLLTQEAASAPVPIALNEGVTTVSVEVMGAPVEGAALTLSLDGMVMSQNLAERLGLEPDRTRRIRGQGGSAELGLAVLESLCLLTCAEDLPVVILPPEVRSNPGSAAIIGLDAFGPVRIDLASELMSRPPAITQNERLETGAPDGRLTLTACGVSLTARLALDQPHSELNARRVNRLRRAGACLQEVGWRKADDDPTLNFLMTGVETDETRFPDFHVSTAPASRFSRGVDVVIGTRLLRHFTLDLDEQMRPVGLALHGQDLPPVYGLGLRIRYSDGGLSIQAIQDGGPIDRDGRLSVGDRIVSLNGVEPQSGNQAEFLAMFSLDEQRDYVFEIARNGGVEQVSLLGQPSLIP